MFPHCSENLPGEVDPSQLTPPASGGHMTYAEGDPELQSPKP